MQLFITNSFIKQDNRVFITEDRIIYQLRKVLRAKPGYKFYLQNISNNEVKRYLLELTNLTDKVDAKIISVSKKNVNSFSRKSVITAILNKFDKMELIVQKLTEIWISEIWFVPAQRSVFKTIKENKLQRFYKISLEAAEQSWSWFLPEIKVYNSLDEIKWNKAILDFNGVFYKQANLSEIDTLLIWPEGGWTQEDLDKLKDYKQISLGDKVLRAETASILGWFILL